MTFSRTNGVLLAHCSVQLEKLERHLYVFDEFEEKFHSFVSHPDIILIRRFCCTFRGYTNGYIETSTYFFHESDFEAEILVSSCGNSSIVIQRWKLIAFKFELNIADFHHPYQFWFNNAQYNGSASPTIWTFSCSIHHEYSDGQCDFDISYTARKNGKIL